VLEVAASQSQIQKDAKMKTNNRQSKQKALSARILVRIWHPTHGLQKPVK
jgi:hypothetical protein